jgi:hypothetical protein
MLEERQKVKEWNGMEWNESEIKTNEFNKIFRI